LEHSTKTGGSIPRLLEFDNITWTQSAQHAKAIKREIAKSFGHLGREFIHYYSKKTLSQRKQLFDACEDELDQLITTRDQYSGRIISKLAIIYMTSKLIGEFFNYQQFSANEIRDCLVDFENGKVPVRSIESQALDIIKTFIIRNQHRMAYKSNKAQLMELSSNGDFIGYKQYISDTIVEVTVLSQVLSKELFQHNISQWSNVLRYLEKQPFIKKYGKDNKVSETDNYLHVKAITFRFQRDTNDELMRWYFSDRGLSSEDKNELKTAPINFENEDRIDVILEA
jgi:putative DNA primase/helicase